MQRCFEYAIPQPRLPHRPFPPLPPCPVFLLRRVCLLRRLPLPAALPSGTLHESENGVCREERKSFFPALFRSMPAPSGGRLDRWSLRYIPAWLSAVRLPGSCCSDRQRPATQPVESLPAGSCSAGRWFAAMRFAAHTRRPLFRRCVRQRARPSAGRRSRRAACWATCPYRSRLRSCRRPW